MSARGGIYIYMHVFKTREYGPGGGGGGGGEGGGRGGEGGGGLNSLGN